MNCFNDYYWPFGTGFLLVTSYIIILSGVLAYILIHVIHKNRNRNSFYPVALDRCPNCRCAVERTYVRCPECHFKLKINCPSCGRMVKTSWEICPYCEQELLVNEKQR